MVPAYSRIILCAAIVLLPLPIGIIAAAVRDNERLTPGCLLLTANMLAIAITFYDSFFG